MKEINVIIVDDEPKCIETLKYMLSLTGRKIKVLNTAESAESAYPIIEKHKSILDILFLDIQMTGGDGFSLLQRFSEITFSVIFITGYDQHALRAIKFSALDYLLKPIDLTELTMALNKLSSQSKFNSKNSHLGDFIKALEQKNLNEKLSFTTLNDIEYVPLKEILYFESDNNYTILHCCNNTLLTSSKNIGYYEELLSSNLFFRIHNSYIVNLNKIKRFIKGKNGMVELEDGSSLQVSIRRKDELLEKLNIRISN